MKNPRLQAQYFKNFKPKKIYSPTNFWDNLIKKNFKLIINGQIKNFRNLNVGFIGFAPFFSEIKRFKIQQKLLSKIKNFVKKSKIIEKGQKKILYLLNSSLNGNERAISQYKILLTDNVKPFLFNFNESKVGNPTEQFKFDNNLFSASSLNYLNGLLFLKKFLKSFDKKIFLEIGGGFGTVGEILDNLKIKQYKYINLDLPH